MDKVHYIRIAANIKDKSYSEISRELGIDWKTVKKYAEKEDLSEKKALQKRKSPVMDPVKPIIDEILKNDKTMPKKQRHTAKRVYERLVEEHDFKGSYSSVRKYISVKKKEIFKVNKSAIPLKHLGGEAQCDFGQALVNYQGKERKGHYLVLSFPYSNVGISQIFWGENAECVIEGMIRIFDKIGGIPNKIWFDNMSSAVAKIYSKGKRTFTEAFKRFSSHYNFEPVFCNPNKGNEKGHVENKVGYIRKNFLVPMPNFNNLDDFNEKLLEKTFNNMKRPHYKKDRTIEELFNYEKAKFMQLPKSKYVNEKLKEAKANNYGFIKFENNTYSASPKFAGEKVWVKIKYDEIEILDRDYNQISIHERFYGKDNESIDWIPYVDEFIKKPRALEYTEFYHSLPSNWKKVLKVTNDKGETLKNIKNILIKKREGTEIKNVVSPINETFNPDLICAENSLGVYDKLLRKREGISYDR